MKTRTTIATLALLALSACNTGANNSSATSSAPVAAVAPPAGTEWATTFAQTPEGGMLMGNPNAPIKVIEYGSLSCPACAAFSAQATKPLTEKYISTGKVSLEYRSLLLHPTDLMSTLAYQCSGPGPFFAMMEASYVDMPNWLNKAAALPQADAQRLQSLPIASQNAEWARVTGTDAFVAQRGVSSETLAQCLSDPKKIAAADQVRKDGFEKYNVQGTPTFFVNGDIIANVATWADLEPVLRANGA